MLTIYLTPAYDCNQCCHGSGQCEPPPAACYPGNNWLLGSFPCLLAQGATMNNGLLILQKLYNWPEQRNWFMDAESGIINSHVISPSEQQFLNLFSWLHFICQILALNEGMNRRNPRDPHSFPSLHKLGSSLTCHLQHSCNRCPIWLQVNKSLIWKIVEFITFTFGTPRTVLFNCYFGHLSERKFIIGERLV